MRPRKNKKRPGFTNDLEETAVKELPQFFEGRGEAKDYNFTMLKRSDFAYIFEINRPNTRTRYEVFERRVDLRYRKISYPKSNSFGIWAKTTPLYDKAVRYFDLINDRNRV